jgi:hypothetical protein
MINDDSAIVAAQRAAARRTRQSSEGALIASADEGARALRREEARLFAERQLRAYEADLIDTLDALVTEISDALVVARRTLELYGDELMPARERLLTGPAARAIARMPNHDEVVRRLADVRRMRALRARLRMDMGA